MSFTKENYSFNSLEDLEKTQKLRAPHKRIVGLAEKSVIDTEYKDAIVYYEQVRRFLHSDDAKQKLEQNIENLLYLGRENDAPPPSPPQQQHQIPSPPSSSYQNSSPNEMQITIDNIQVSGIQMSGGEKAVEALGKMINPNYQPSEHQEIEQSIQNHQEEHGISQETRIIEEQIYQEVVNRKEDEKNKATEEIDPIEDISDEAKKTTENKPSPNQDNKENIDSGHDSTGHNNKKEDTEEILPKKIDDNGQENPFFKEGEGNQEPIKVEQVKSKPKIEKTPNINLTYNFSNIFHNRFYLKYEEMFNEAAKLVKDKKLDEAIDYYNVLLDQKLPETMKMMIQQNINDLRTTILNTFRQSNTIVKLDESGRPVVMDSDTVHVFEQKSGTDDVYFKEES